MISEIWQKHVKPFKRPRFGPNNDLHGGMRLGSWFSVASSHEIFQFFNKIIDFPEILSKTEHFQKFQRQGTIMGEKVPKIHLKIEFLPIRSEGNGLYVEEILKGKGDLHVLKGEQPVLVEIKKNRWGVFQEMLIEQGFF